MNNYKNQDPRHYWRFIHMRNPLNASGFSGLGRKYNERNTKEKLFVNIHGLAKNSLLFSNPESANIPFFKRMLEVYAFAEVELNSPLPDLPEIANLKTRIIDRGKNGKMKEISAKLNSCFKNPYQLSTNNYVFEQPPSFFNKLRIRVFYCEGVLYTPVEHSCDKLDLWPEWPDEPADDSFLSELIIHRNSSDVYELLTDGKGQYINASGYYWDTREPQTLAWYIHHFVNNAYIKPSNPLFKMTMRGLIKTSEREKLQLYIHAQKVYFKAALSEIKFRKRKMSHWMWFIFPQMMFKYPSELSLVYALDINLMFKYRKDEYLMKNMEEMLLALLADDCPANVGDVFGKDAGKFKNSLWFFIHFDTEFVSFRSDFVLPEIGDLFKKVYTKFFSESTFVEEYSSLANKFTSDNYKHFYILLMHFKKNANWIGK